MEIKPSGYRMEKTSSQFHRRSEALPIESWRQEVARESRATWALLYCQHYLANGQVWRMFFLHLWLVVPLGVGYVTLIPRYHSESFAIANLAAWCVFALALAWNHRRFQSRTPIEILNPVSLA